MTGGRLKRVADYVKEEDSFCLTYGDGVGDVDILGHYKISPGAWKTCHYFNHVSTGSIRCFRYQKWTSEKL